MTSPSWPSDQEIKAVLAAAKSAAMWFAKREGDTVTWDELDDESKILWISLSFEAIATYQETMQ